LKPEEWVAVATFALAAATVWLALEARQARNAAKKAEDARQGSAEVGAIPLILMPEPSVTQEGTEHFVRFNLHTPQTGPMLSVKISFGRDGMEPAVLNAGTFPPDRNPETRPLPIPGFLDPGPPLAAPMDPHEVIVDYRGLLGQRIVEHYEWRLRSVLDASLPPDPTRWRLARLEIIPTVGSGVDLTFDERTPVTA
jgi:hypothetical protein